MLVAVVLVTSAVVLHGTRQDVDVFRRDGTDSGPCMWYHFIWADEGFRRVEFSANETVSVRVFWTDTREYGYYETDHLDVEGEMSHFGLEVIDGDPAWVEVTIYHSGLDTAGDVERARMLLDGVFLAVFFVIALGCCAFLCQVWSPRRDGEEPSN